VLSHPDICVLALTYLLSKEDEKLKEKEAALTARINDQHLHHYLKIDLSLLGTAKGHREANGGSAR